MSESAGTELDAALDESDVEPTDDSLLANLRAKRQAIGERKDLVLDIPGYGGQLVARYRYVPYEEISGILRKAQKKIKDPEIEAKAAADVLIKMCAEILTRREPGEQPIGLGQAVKELEGETITYSDPRLAQVVGVQDALPERANARSLVRAVFGNDYALIGHQEEVAAWAQDSERDQDF